MFNYNLFANGPLFVVHSLNLLVLKDIFFDLPIIKQTSSFRKIICLEKLNVKKNYLFRKTDCSEKSSVCKKKIILVKLFI